MKINLNDFRYYNCDDCPGCRSCHLPQDLEGCSSWRDYIRDKLKCYAGQRNWGIAYHPPKAFENKIAKIIFDWADDGEVLIQVVNLHKQNDSWVIPIEEYWAWHNFQCQESAEMVLRCCK